MLNALTVYDCGSPMCRIGSQADGGYLCPQQDHNAYDLFIACGLEGM